MRLLHLPFLVTFVVCLSYFDFCGKVLEKNLKAREVSLFKEVDNLVQTSNGIKWPKNYLENEVRIRKVGIKAQKLGLRMLGDEAGRGGYLELMLKGVPTELFPGILHLIMQFRILLEPTITLTHSLVALYRVHSDSASAAPGLAILKNMLQDSFLADLRKVPNHTEEYISSIRRETDDVVQGTASESLQDIPLPKNLLAIYDKKNLIKSNKKEPSRILLHMGDYARRLERDPEAARLTQTLTSVTVDYWRRYVQHAHKLPNALWPCGAMLGRMDSANGITRHLLNTLKNSWPDIFTLHPTYTWNRLSAALYLLEFIQSISLLEEPLDGKFIMEVDQITQEFIDASQKYHAEWKRCKSLVASLPLDEVYLQSSPKYALVHRPTQVSEAHQIMSLAKVYVVQYSHDIPDDCELWSRNRIYISRTSEGKLNLECVLHVSKDQLAPGEENVVAKLKLLYSVPGHAITFGNLALFFTTSKSSRSE